MNRWYSRINGGPVASKPMNAPIFQIMRAMQNPAEFVKEQFPDVPENIRNDPNEILRYLQQSRGISNQYIQQLMNGGK